MKLDVFENNIAKANKFYNEGLFLKSKTLYEHLLPNVSDVLIQLVLKTRILLNLLHLSLNNKNYLQEFHVLLDSLILEEKRVSITNSEFYLNLSRVLLEKSSNTSIHVGDLQEALKLINKSILIDNKNAELFHIKGTILLRLSYYSKEFDSELKEPICYFYKAVECGRIATNCTLAEIYLEHIPCSTYHDAIKAKELLDTYLEHYPDDLIALKLRSIAFLRTGSYQCALDDNVIAISLIQNQNDADKICLSKLYNEKGLILTRFKRNGGSFTYKEIIDCFKESISLYGDEMYDNYTSKIYLNIGDALVELHKNYEAINYFNYSIKGHKSCENLFNRGRCFLRMSAFAFAQKDFLEAKKINDNSSMKNYKIDSDILGFLAIIKNHNHKFYSYAISDLSYNDLDTVLSLVCDNISHNYKKSFGITARYEIDDINGKRVFRVFLDKEGVPYDDLSLFSNYYANLLLDKGLVNKFMITKTNLTTLDVLDLEKDLAKGINYDKTSIKDLPLLNDNKSQHINVFIDALDVNFEGNYQKGFVNKLSVVVNKNKYT